MANFFVSYDLNGQRPTHAEMDEHLRDLGKCVHRVLETVWYVKYSGDGQALCNYVRQILSNNDSVLVIDANQAVFRNLLIADETLQSCWRS